MRGIQIQVSLGYFLSFCGLDRGDIELAACSVDINTPDTFIIVLRGEDIRLPEVEYGQVYPKGQVIITQDPKTCKLTGKIRVEE